MTITPIALDRVADRLRALSDPTRLNIVRFLGDGECCQCDIRDDLGTAQPLLSFHLKVLREAGLIRGRRRGKWVFYSIRQEALAEIASLVTELMTTRTSARCCGAPNQADSTTAQPRRT